MSPINSPSKNKNIVLEIMKESKKIVEELNQSCFTVTFDLAIAKIAMQIQASHKPLFDNIFIHLVCW